MVQNVVGGSLNSGGNDRYGIHVAGVSNLVKGNAVEDNAESGVYLVGQGNDVLRNSVCQNGAQLQNGTDINVTLSAENNTVRHNQAFKIVVSNSNNLVKNNKRCR